MSDEKTAKRRVTLRDVAQAAGVSLKTASNVINGSGRMTDETRTKVETVIKGLGYQQAPVVVAGEDHWSGFRPDRIKAIAAVALAMSA